MPALLGGPGGSPGSGSILRSSRRHTRAKNELCINYPRVATRASPGGMMLTQSRFLQELPDDLDEELRVKRSCGW